MSHDNFSAIAFLNSLSDAIPEAGKVIDENHTSSRNRLPHMEMGDLTRWFIDQYRTSRREGIAAERARVTLAQFLWILEASFEVGDQVMDDLIATSFLENLHQAGDDLPAITDLLPPKLLAWYTDYA